MASANKMIMITIFLMIMVTSLISVKCAGKVYKVGDSAGWTTIGNVDYNKWASPKTFRVGDTIEFEYHAQVHNVMEVSLSDFRTCNAAAPIKTYDTGNDSIAIKAPGHYYFICGIPGHCQVGQKVDIRVPKTFHTTTSPNVSPAPAPALLASSPLELIAPSPAANKAASSALDSKWVGLSVFSLLAVYVYGFA